MDNIFPERSQQIDTSTKPSKKKQTFNLDLPDFPDKEEVSHQSQVLDDRSILDKIQNTIREYNYLLTS